MWRKAPSPPPVMLQLNDRPLTLAVVLLADRNLDDSLKEVQPAYFLPPEKLILPPSWEPHFLVLSLCFSRPPLLPT